MSFCPQCGSENPPEANFCSACGTRLRTQQPTGDWSTTVSMGREETPGDESMVLSTDDQAAVDALPVGSALLVVLRGPNAGSRFLLDTDLVTAGRHPDSDIFLDDITVSRRHAELERTGQGYEVRDVGSLNGTYVNRDRIDKTLLSNGDELQIGKFRLVYYASQRGFGGGAR